MTAWLDVKNLCLTYPTVYGPLQAVRQVSFTLERGQSLALVGESGCGKSSIARALLHLDKPTAGQVIFEGEDLSTLSSRALHKLRRRLSIVFQNPYSSLNPRMRVRDLVGEPLLAHKDLKAAYPSKEARRTRVAELLESVGLSASQGERFPHEFSGGQRQRIAIARALAQEPELLVLDEPTAALDVSVQSQVLELLADLKTRLGLSYLFITHNLAIVNHLAENALVMYLGRIVEQGPTLEVLTRPQHPYSQALLDSLPRLNPALRGRLKPPQGDLPSPLSHPQGCAFASRCGSATQTCRTSAPSLTAETDSAPGAALSPRRLVACHHPLLTDGLSPAQAQRTQTVQTVHSTPAAAPLSPSVPDHDQES
ncbi:ABC transporter ATP-binding protein [Rhodovibrionaceae bacterium A322]